MPTEITCDWARLVGTEIQAKGSIDGSWWGAVKPSLHQDWIITREHGFKPIEPQFTDEEKAAIIRIIRVEWRHTARLWNGIRHRGQNWQAHAHRSRSD